MIRPRSLVVFFSEDTVLVLDLSELSEVDLAQTGSLVQLTRGTVHIRQKGSTKA